MTDLLIQENVLFVNAGVEALGKEFEKTLDFTAYEQGVNQLLNEVSAQMVTMKLTELYASAEFLEQLKAFGASRGMRFKEYRSVTLALANGKSISVPTPYFLKAQAKRGRKKRGPNGRGAYLGLDLLGFIGHGSPALVSDVVQMAVLCPSFEVAHTVLNARGISVDESTIQRYCRQLAQKGMAWRGQVSLRSSEKLKGYTLVIGIDGGRLRERCTKRGPHCVYNELDVRHEVA